MTKQELIGFEEEIKDEFLAGNIRAPIHLSRGNEDALINIFHLVNKNDWVFSNHRSHYHALLHGIDKGWLRDEIMAGRSMHIFSKEHKFLTSSIVNGCTPIAVGVAMANKLKKNGEWVWCFVGDMAYETGTFMECYKYASRQNLPITFVVEDNGLSTNTPTQETWGDWDNPSFLIKYSYERGFPHINIGEWVTFR